LSTFIITFRWTALLYLLVKDGQPKIGGYCTNLFVQLWKAPTFLLGYSKSIYSNFFITENLGAFQLWL